MEDLLSRVLQHVSSAAAQTQQPVLFGDLWSSLAPAGYATDEIYAVVEALADVGALVCYEHPRHSAHSGAWSYGPPGLTPAPRPRARHPIPDRAQREHRPLARCARLNHAPGPA